MVVRNIPLWDRRELELPPVGIVQLLDAETGERLELDTSLQRVRTEFQAMASRRIFALKSLLRNCKVDFVEVYSDLPYETPLIDFFQRRARRLQH